MFINREQVKTNFYKYVCDYDISDVKIKLKLDHTYVFVKSRFYVVSIYKHG